MVRTFWEEIAIFISYENLASAPTIIIQNLTLLDMCIFFLSIIIREVLMNQDFTSANVVAISQWL